MDKLTVELREQAQVRKPSNGIDVTSEELLYLLSCFDLYGMWRAELDTGLVYWTEDVFRIHRMEVSAGPINLKDAISRYHRDDQKFVAQAIEDVAKHKSAFRFVLRLGGATDEQDFVKCTGHYRESTLGRQEVWGTFSKLLLPKRALALKV